MVLEVSKGADEFHRPVFDHQMKNGRHDPWPALADALNDQTGIDVAFRQPGGLVLALSDHELAKQADVWKRFDA
jgi:hypothetical protein